MPGRRRAYRLTPRVVADLEEIWLYTSSNWSLEQADSYHNAIVDALDGLAAGKKAGRPVDIRDGYFKYLVGSHLVFYRRGSCRRSRATSAHGCWSAFVAFTPRMIVHAARF